MASFASRTAMATLILSGVVVGGVLAAAAPPNILLLMTDQQRFDAMGDTLTPHIRRLAAQGAEFVHAYVSTPVCTPARASLLTGRAAWRHGLLAYGEIASEYERTMPSTLAAQGYKTAVVGKNHFGWNATSDTGVSHGFEILKIYDGLGSGFDDGSEYDDYARWFQQQRPGKNPLKTGGLGWNTWGAAPYAFEEWLHPTAWTGRVAVEQVRELAAGPRPFFLKVSFHRPHSPYDPPQRFLNSTSAPEAPPAISSDGWDAQYRDCASRGSKSQWCGEVDERDLQLTRRAYLALTTQVDEQIGHILAALEGTGVLNKTFVLFVSDHGDEQMDHYLWKKGYPYQGSTHVPMIIRWPESMDPEMSIPRGSTVRAVVELRDIFPTFLDVSGSWSDHSESDFDGRPLTWLLKGNASTWRQWIDLELGEFYMPPWNALTDGEMKFVFHAEYRHEQLFNLTEDPGERRDLAADPRYEGLLTLWRQRLARQFETDGRGLGWVWGGTLMPRPWIPCIYGPNYPGFSSFKAVCVMASTVSWPILMAAVCLVLSATTLCLCCLCRRAYKRRRARRRRECEERLAGDCNNVELEQAVDCENVRRRTST
mmetsp:Transcript_79283/g.232887  ORF Transcript_79283/g.232887 Transcript_79283/m.232887 type:complete len:595 (+) Transcript_79283:23-1807(+)